MLGVSGGLGNLLRNADKAQLITHYCPKYFPLEILLSTTVHYQIHYQIHNNVSAHPPEAMGAPRPRININGSVPARAGAVNGTAI